LNIEKIKKNKLSAFTLIEALVFIFIFALITVTFYQVFSVGTRYIIDSKNRLGAVSLANERMEMVRNLSYANIGTVDGTVGGNIPQEQNIMENGRTYKVKTEVTYEEDPLDGVYPSDTAWEDYKKVTIIVSWNSDQAGSGEVSLTSRFVPPGLEVANPNDGILSINIFSDQPGGTGIPHTNVHVKNSETGLDTTLETDDSGNLMLMGNHVTQSIQKYEITVSKDGYETIATMPPYPDTSYIPTNVHASVILGSVNVANIVQNELADLKIKTEDGLGQAMPNVDFDLVGGKILGTSATFPNDPIYNIDGSYATGSNGEKDLNDISPGQFTIAPSVPTGYELININPGDEFSLYSSTPLTVTARLAPKNITSLLVNVQEIEDGVTAPISGAQVKLSNTATGGTYNTTVTSAENGAAYFPVNSDLFVAGDYDLKITAAGFSENTSTVKINENELKINPVTLSP
jgi:type II secretory pathway pseudopilin PulG